MPKKPEGQAYKNLPKGFARQVGSSLSYSTNASIFGYFGHPDGIRLGEYERARSTDDTIGAGIEFIKLAILASVGPYNHKNPKIKDFVIENLNRMEGNHLTAIGELTDSALGSGFGLSETIYKAADDHIWIDYIANYNPRTITIYVNDKGRLTEGEVPPFNSVFTTGIWQDRFGQVPVRLPLARCCLVTHNKRFGNLYGESGIKRIYKNWRLKEATLEMWNVALDRYGTPVAFAIVPNGLTGKTIADPGAPGGIRPETIGDAAGIALSNIHTGTGLVLEQPSPNDPIELGTLTTGNNFGDSFIQAINYYNKAMYRGLLIPQLLLSEQETGGIGSGSASKVHFDVFKMLLRALFAEIVEPFVEQVIGRLIRINFGDSDPGSFELRPWDPTTAELMANVFQQMITNGAVDNTDIQEINMMRQAVGLEPLDEKRAKRLAEINYNGLLRQEHMESESMELRSTTTATPSVSPNGKTERKAISKSGGGSSGGAAAGPTKTVAVQEQVVNKPIPKPPRPVKDPGSADPQSGGSVRKAAKPPRPMKPSQVGKK